MNLQVISYHVSYQGLQHICLSGPNNMVSSINQRDILWDLQVVQVLLDHIMTEGAKVNRALG